MGATPGQNGVTFRVWAPHARKVFVTGSFNDWSYWRTPLAHDRNGYWSANVAQARPGDRYKYVIHNGAEILSRSDPYARVVTGRFRNSVVLNKSTKGSVGGRARRFQPPSKEELVIYELHVGTFEEGARDGVGTFQGVIDKMPYLHHLGINAIELMPIKEFPGKRSWGYNPAFPFAVASAYGGRKALKALVAAAHHYQIAVIVDVVYNHFGPEELDLWRFDGWHEPTFGGIYFFNDWRAETPWAHTRPDYGRPEVRQFLRDNALMWLEELNVDGLRWDATSFIRNVRGGDGDPDADIPEGWHLMRWVNDEVHTRHASKFTIAEDMQGNSWITKPTSHGGAGFDVQWDANFVHTLRQAIIPAHDDVRDMEAVGHAIAFRYNDDAFDRVLYTESHDEVANGKARVPEDIAPENASSHFAKKRSALGAALVFTAPGIPMIFQGQEFLEDGWFDDRSPLDWEKAYLNAGMVYLYRDLARLRRNWYGTTRGLMGHHVNISHINDDDKLIAFHRWQRGGEGDDVLVIANFANILHDDYIIGFPHPGHWHVRFNSDWRKYDPGFGNQRCPHILAVGNNGHRSPDAMPCWGNVSIAPYSVLILSQG
jgi:1,4-alpha-glucan branching enzyme